MPEGWRRWGPSVPLGVRRGAGSSRGGSRSGRRRCGSGRRGTRFLAPTLLPDHDAVIVTYCSNPACPNSGQVADRLTHLGYTNVRKYAEGIEDWTNAGLPTESA